MREMPPPLPHSRRPDHARHTRPRQCRCPRCSRRTSSRRCCASTVRPSTQRSKRARFPAASGLVAPSASRATRCYNGWPKVRSRAKAKRQKASGVNTKESILRDWLEAAQRRAGLRVMGSLHRLRHTFCSHLAMRGAPAKAIQELAGHESLTTTLRYMHLTPGARDEAIAAAQSPGGLRQPDGNGRGGRQASSGNRH